MLTITQPMHSLHGLKVLPVVPSEKSVRLSIYRAATRDSYIIKVFIYSCPSSSPIKHRMLYSSGASSVLQSAKGILSLSPGSSALAARRIETSDPAELTEEYLIAELGLDSAAAAASSIPTTLDGEKKAFARPKGPGRKR